MWLKLWNEKKATAEGYSGGEFGRLPWKEEQMLLKESKDFEIG